MIAETLATTVLEPLAPGAVFPDVAPEGAPLPRIVYQQVGGQEVAYLEDTPPDTENARMQIACWAATRVEAATLAQQVRDALTQAAGLQARPIGARNSVFETDTRLYGTRQDFSVWYAR